MDLVVSDFSPLVHLSRLSLMFVLPALYDRVLVPDVVWHEVGLNGGEIEAKAVQAAKAEGWLEVEGIRLDRSRFPSTRQVDDGELGAIQLAQANGALLLIDDLLGRELALSVGLQITGTVGVLVRAREQGLIESVKDSLDRLLVETNFRMSPELYRKALKRADEQS